MVGDEARWQDSDLRVRGEAHRGCPVFVVEVVVESDLVLDEAFPLVEPFVTDDVPDSRLALQILTGFLRCDNQFSLNFAATGNGFQLFDRDLARVVSQVLVERQRLEL